MTRTALLGAAALAALLAGCSSHSAAPAAPPSTTRAAAVAAPLLPGCASALAGLPKSAPGTAQQAGTDFRALAGEKGTTAGSMGDEVAADSSDIAFDLDEGGPVTSDISKWEADAASLRSFCS
jgi:hypothetical protein